MKEHEHIKRLRIAAKEMHGLRTLTAIANALNISPQTVNNWASRGVSKTGLLQIQDQLGIVAAYVEHGNLPMDVAALAGVAHPVLGTRKVPLIDGPTADSLDDKGGISDAAAAQSFLVTELQVSPRSFALEVAEPSMVPALNPGDRCILDPDVAPSPGDWVAALTNQFGTVFMKYRPIARAPTDRPEFDLVPLNSDYPTLSSRQGNEIAVLGVVVEHRSYRSRRS